MSASQSGTFNVQEFTDLGAPLVGGRLYTYAYGTTTQKTAYTDHAGVVPHTYTSDGGGGQYIALNSRGELPAPLYLVGGSYDLALKTAAGATVWTRRADPVWDIVNDFSTSSGASLVGYLPAGAGSVATTVQSRLRNTIFITNNGATGSGANETTLAQAALNSGAKKVIIPAGMTIGVSSLTIAADQTLVVDGTINKLSGSGAVLTLGNRSRVVGSGFIICNGFSGDVIAASSTTGNVIKGVQLSGNVGNGIGLYAGCSRFQIKGNFISNVNGNAIQVSGIFGTPCKNGIIEGNHVWRTTMPLLATNYHGIVWTGGDASTSSLIGVTGLTITGNVVENVVGGIWGQLGSTITVSGNTVNNVSDVGIDFEGGFNLTCTGNTVEEAANGCYALFYGASYATISGNTARNITSTGAGLYVFTNASYSTARITVSGNNFYCNKHCIDSGNFAGLGINNSSITGNNFQSGNVSAISIFQTNNMLISDNHVTCVGSTVGIELQGVSNSMIRENSIFGFSDPSVSPGASGGIWLYQQSTTWPSQSNVVRGNRVDSFNYSIVDNCAIDVTKSKNDIEHNHVLNVYRSAGGTYNGVIANNLNFASPVTSVSATTF